MSNGTYARGRRKHLKGSAGFAVASDLTIPVPESLILRILRDAAVQLSGSNNIVAGRDVLFAGRDINITITLVVEAPDGARPQPAGKVARADSGRSKRVSR
jgi:hypothetical protein